MLADNIFRVLSLEQATISRGKESPPESPGILLFPTEHWRNNWPILLQRALVCLTESED